MTNERLRTAMDRSGVTIEQLARDVGTVPKTVQRWIAGRAPHPRTRWEVAQRLDESMEYLWPDARHRQTDARAGADEIIAAYPFRADVDVSRWWGLITGAESQIDLLGYTLYFLPQQHPELIPVLLDKCTAGCEVRLIVAGPDSENLRRRDEEERVPITLAARVQSSLAAFKPLLESGCAQLRYQDVPLYNSIFRFDDQMFLTPHLYATPGYAAPLLHLRRLGDNGLFSRFASHFEAIWTSSTPHGHPGQDGRVVDAQS
jgi:transcriptional regulator with XRE-family HTH domain